jgi:hypothetical protein
VDQGEAYGAGSEHQEQVSKLSSENLMYSGKAFTSNEYFLVVA